MDENNKPISIDDLESLPHGFTMADIHFEYKGEVKHLFTWDNEEGLLAYLEEENSLKWVRYENAKLILKKYEN